MAANKKGELSENEEKLVEKINENDGSFEEVQNLLKEKDVRVDCLDSTGMTPLQHAAFRGKKELCELLLAHGADVNSNYHDNSYTALMFATLSGNVEVTRLMLQAGANIHHVNSVNRTATQMAAFVGQHQCVSAINNFFPKADLEYFTVPQGLEKEAKLPAQLVPSLLGLVNSVNLNPVKLSMYLRDHMELIHESYKVAKVLDVLVEKNMKARDTNDVMAVKLHYFATLIRLARTSHDDKNDNLEFWIKSLVRGRDGDGFPEKMERLIRQALKEFPYVESQLLQTLVRQISSVKIGDQPSALQTLIQGVNGQQFAMDDDTCNTCSEKDAIKKCSVCKYAQYCSQYCQKLHWSTHKKFCKKLAELYEKNEKLRIKMEEKQKAEEEKKKIEEEIRKTEEEMRNKLQGEKQKAEEDKKKIEEEIRKTEEEVRKKIQDLKIENCSENGVKLSDGVVKQDSDKTIPDIKRTQDNNGEKLNPSSEEEVKSSETQSS
ncbi:ankyrin repeat and MYND domain-containing protein 2 isoform X2 [Patella vulgata]|uniref:ankyrin repeat and MYND domain-containing protein 2 isoform X2 n=1 Tax=Patella vulgata TaxID=6465 RepID=UPI00217FA98B|nr:ankyrin repeat and MYND domain-containing protein 2 isoform X2 [Patella vulgata]